MYKSINALSISPSPVTTVHCVWILSNISLIAVVAESSASSFLPYPSQRAEANAVASVTLTNSID